MSKKYLRVHPFLWNEGKSSQSEGVMVRCGGGWVFIPYTYVLSVSDQIVDLLEQHELQQETR